MGWYVFAVLFRTLRRGEQGAGEFRQQLELLDWTDALHGLFALALLLFLLAGWIFPGRRAALQFSETELAFFLPAPATRRHWIQYKLVRSQIGLVFTSLIFTLISGRIGRDPLWAVHLTGMWILLFTLRLHGLAASFTMTRWWDRGLTPWRRRWMFLGIALGVFSAIWLWLRHSLPPFPGLEDSFEDSLEPLLAWFGSLFTTGPLLWLLAPLRCLSAPWFVQDWAGALPALIPALALMWLHYRWVLQAEVSFEEASLDWARRMSEIQAAARRGSIGIQGRRRGRRDPFKLRSKGSPVVALLWKNLVTAGIPIPWRWTPWIYLGAAILMWALSEFGYRSTFIVLTAIAIWGLVFSSLVGGLLIRCDFRTDLPHMDLLKTYPLRGWQMVVGQLLAPVLILTWFQGLCWVLLTVGASTLSNVLFPAISNFPFQEWAPTFLGLLLLLPSMNGVALLIPNAVALYLPAWTPRIAAGQTPGMEQLGQNILTFLAYFLFLLSALFLPGIVLALTVVVAAAFGALPIGILIGCLLASGVLLLEIGLTVRVLGPVFEKFDISAESL